LEPLLHAILPVSLHINDVYEDWGTV
jgi:hypothetical protein